MTPTGASNPSSHVSAKGQSTSFTQNIIQGVAGGEPPALIERVMVDFSTLTFATVSPGVSPQPSLNVHWISFTCW